MLKNIIKNVLRKIYFLLCDIKRKCSLFQVIESFRKEYHNSVISSSFGSIGADCILGANLSISGAEYIHLGSNCIIGNYCVFEAIDRWQKKFTPSIRIGHNTIIGENSHLTAIGNISIGNNVITGRYILITDNIHGQKDYSDIHIPPIERNLTTKGGVTICDNVWIGDKVSILSGVTIGEGAILGTNSVVTKDVPPYTIVAGIPAKVIKVIDKF